MPQPKKGPRLGSGPKHQRSMLSNLASSLFEHGRIKTTEAKAKALRPYAEHLITKAKKGTVHDRRQVLSVIEDRDVVHKLFAEIAPAFAERNGGYTRILKLAPRSGDGAPLVLVELVAAASMPHATTEEGETERKRLRRPGRRRAAGGRPAPAEAAEATAEETLPEEEPVEEEVVAAEIADDEEAAAPPAEAEEPGEETEKS